MKYIIVAAAAVVLGIGAAPQAQAEPQFCERHNSGEIYIHACAGGGGGGGPAPFYAIVHDPVTGKVVRNPITNRIVKTCRSACDDVAPEDRTIND